MQIALPYELTAVSPTFAGLLALLLAIPSGAAIAIGTYRLLYPALERTFGLASEEEPRSPARLGPIELIVLGLSGLLLTGALTTLLLAVG